MLGKSWGYRGRLILVGLLLLVGCARNIPADKATGEDGKVKGAKALELDNGEARATGIVTYPGGDRVDWKVLELPEGKSGTLEFKLTWTPPRPGLQLAFDVFDQYGKQVTGSKRKSRKRSRGKIRTATVKDAKGKYFIRVQAVGRGDAGKYRLRVEFNEGDERTASATEILLKADIPPPPNLPDVPAPEQGCDEFTFDPKIPACRSICPAAGAPPGWPACKGKCPNPPTVDEPACWATMPCPPGQPDERIKACTIDKFPPCDKTNPDMRNPKCRVKAAPVVGRILQKQVQSGELIITIGAGTNQGVKRDWTGTVIRGNDVNDAAVPGGAVRIVRVDTDRTVGRVNLTPDQIASTPYVRLSPP